MHSFHACLSAGEGRGLGTGARISRAEFSILPQVEMSQLLSDEIHPLSTTGIQRSQSTRTSFWKVWELHWDLQREGLKGSQQETHRHPGRAPGMLVATVRTQGSSGDIFLCKTNFYLENRVLCTFYRCSRTTSVLKNFKSKSRYTKEAEGSM